MPVVRNILVVASDVWPSALDVFSKKMYKPALGSPLNRSTPVPDRTNDVPGAARRRTSADA